MGNNCTSCCNNIEKKFKQMKEDELEFKYSGNRQMINNNLSMIVEDAYESQLSQQNSHLGVSMNIPSNTLNSINTALCPPTHHVINFWILDIQERVILVSNVNEPNLHMKIQVTFNEQTEEYCLFEEIAYPGSSSTNSSLTSLNNIKGTPQNNANNNNNNNTLKENTANSITNFGIAVNGSNVINNNNNNNNNNNVGGGNGIPNNAITSDQLNFIANKKYHSFPFERQISQFFHFQFERQEYKAEHINDFQTPDDMQHSIIDTWKEILQRVFKLAGIQANSNLIIINNFLRFARQASTFSSISEMLLKFVFEKLKVARFSICSSGVPILKFVNRKNGIVFDMLDSGHIYCLPVHEGTSLDQKFRIIYIYPTSQQVKGEAIDSSCASNHNNNVNSQVGVNHNPIQLPQPNNSSIQSLFPTATSPPNIMQTSSVLPKKDSFQKDIAEFLDSLDHEFMLSCFKSRSIVINNQCKNEGALTTIIQILNSYFLQIMPPNDDSILNMFQPLLPKQPKNTRVFGAADLLKLNVIETISKSRYERLGPIEIIKQNIFL